LRAGSGRWRERAMGGEMRSGEGERERGRWDLERERGVGDAINKRGGEGDAIDEREEIDQEIF
jgi:hypothetical protein